MPPEELASRIHALVIRLLRQVRAADSGLGLARMSALSTLMYDGPLTVGELAAAEQVGAPATSRLVTALERRGYVRRVDDDTADGSRVRVTVTPAGVRALEAARGQRAEQLASLLEDMDGEERSALDAAVRILETALAGGPGPDASASRGTGTAAGRLR